MTWLALLAGCWVTDPEVSAWRVNRAPDEVLFFDENGEVISAEDGGWTEVAVGDWHSCGLRQDGTALCWGCGEDDSSSVNEGQCDAPPVAFEHVAAAGLTSCGLTAAGEIQCWGEELFGGPLVALVETMELDSGALCGVTSGGGVECAGRVSFTSTPGGAIEQVDVATSSTGNTWACGLRDTTEIECWCGYVIDGECSAAPLGGSYARVSVGHGIGCALTTGGLVTCWGDGDSERLEAPNGVFVSIVVGEVEVVALDAGGHAVSWGVPGFEAPTGWTFSQIQLGGLNGCGVTLDGDIRCWGVNNGGASEPP